MSFADVPLVHETEIVEGARVELLRRLAWFRDYVASLDDWRPEDVPTFAPLFGGVWESRMADLELAVAETEKLGEVRLTSGWGFRRVQITDRGYERAQRYGYRENLEAEPSTWDALLFKRAVRNWRLVRQWERDDASRRRNG